VTLAPGLFPVFCATLCLTIQQPHSLNKVQYLADGDVRNVTRFQAMMTQVPKSNNANASQSHCPHSCLPVPVESEVLLKDSALLADLSLSLAAF